MQPGGPPKRMRVENPEPDTAVLLVPGERYPRIVHRTNLNECRDIAPRMNGDFVCNNWQIRGHCVDTCSRASSHVTLTGDLKAKYRIYAAQLRKMAQDYSQSRSPQPSKGGPKSQTPLKPNDKKDHDKASKEG
jgi:hypothetical protein